MGTRDHITRMLSLAKRKALGVNTVTGTIRSARRATATGIEQPEPNRRGYAADGTHYFILGISRLGGTDILR